MITSPVLPPPPKTFEVRVQFAGFTGVSLNFFNWEASVCAIL